MSGRGGGRPASTRSRLPAGSGKRRAEWDSGGLNDRHYLGRVPLPHPRTQLQRTRKSAPPQRRQKRCRIFPASREQRAGCSGIVTMWKPNEPVVEDISDLASNDMQSKRRRSRRRAWRDGLADQTVVKALEDVRSYRAFERALIGSIDPRSVFELALGHRLASLLWRLRRAIAIETGLFEIQSERLLACRQDPSRAPGELMTLPTPPRANRHSKVPRSNNGSPDRPASDPEQRSRSERPPLGPWSKSRTLAQCFLALSNLDPTLLDRVGSYEARLWRQAAQTIWTLEAMRQPPPSMRQRLRNRVAPFTWDRQR